MVILVTHIQETSPQQMGVVALMKLERQPLLLRTYVSAPPAEFAREA